MLLSIAQANCTGSDPLRGGSDGRAKGVSLRRKQRPPEDKPTNVDITQRRAAAAHSVVAGQTVAQRKGASVQKSTKALVRFTDDYFKYEVGAKGRRCGARRTRARGALPQLYRALTRAARPLSPPPSLARAQLGLGLHRPELDTDGKTKWLTPGETEPIYSREGMGRPREPAARPQTASVVSTRETHLLVERALHRRSVVSLRSLARRARRAAAASSRV